MTFFGLYVNSALAYSPFIIGQISFEGISEHGGNTQISVYQPQNYWHLGCKTEHHTTMQIGAMSLPTPWGISEQRSAGGVCGNGYGLVPAPCPSFVRLSESNCDLGYHHWPLATLQAECGFRWHTEGQIKVADNWWLSANHNFWNWQQDLLGRGVWVTQFHVYHTG